MSVFVALGSPKLNIIFSMWSQDRENHFPQSDQNIFVDTAQYVVGLHCCDGTLLQCISLSSTRNPWSFSRNLFYG